MENNNPNRYKYFDITECKEELTRLDLEINIIKASMTPLLEQRAALMEKYGKLDPMQGKGPIEQFIFKHCKESPEGMTLLSKLFKAFDNFQTQAGYRRISRPNFIKEMAARGYFRDYSLTKNDKRLYIRGIELEEAQE